jgi:hypothetical protein
MKLIKLTADVLGAPAGKVIHSTDADAAKLKAAGQGVEVGFDFAERKGLDAPPMDKALKNAPVAK